MSLMDFFRPRSDGRAEPTPPTVYVPLVDSPPPAKGRKRAIIATAITAALAAIYVNEGGYVNDPADRGGATRFGVTEATARRWGYSGDMRVFPKHCDAANPVCADLIYRTDYIEKPGYLPLASIEPAVLFELSDSAVLHGPARASGWFIGAVNKTCRTNLPASAKVPPVAIQAYADCANNLGKVKVCVAVLDAMDDGQRAFFDRIVARNPSQQKFYRGWIRGRIGNVPRSKCNGGTA